MNNINRMPILRLDEMSPSLSIFLTSYILISLFDDINTPVLFRVLLSDIQYES